MACRELRVASLRFATSAALTRPVLLQDMRMPNATAPSLQLGELARRDQKTQLLSKQIDSGGCRLLTRKGRMRARWAPLFRHRTPIRRGIPLAAVVLWFHSSIPETRQRQCKASPGRGSIVTLGSHLDTLTTNDPWVRIGEHEKVYFLFSAVNIS